MDLSFITRSLKMTAGLAVLGFLFATVYGGWSWGLGFVLGAFWGVANLYLIKTLIGRVITLDNRDWLSVGVFLLVKFPLLYVLGYLIISRDWYTVWAPVAGFSLSIVVIVLKAGGRAIMKMDEPKRRQVPNHSGVKS